VPLPLLQFVPPSVLYCHETASLASVTLTWPLLVTPSLLELPVSLASARAAVVGAVTSTVTAPRSVLGPLVPPLVCRTRT